MAADQGIHIAPFSLATYPLSISGVCSLVFGAFIPMCAGIVFRSDNGAHAVVETVFFFEFSERVISDNSVEGHLAGAYVDSLPHVEEAPSFELTLDPTSQEPIHRVSKSYVFSCNGEDEAPEWAVRIMDGTQLSIHCTSYTRWEAVSKRAFEYLNAFARCAQHKLELNSFGFKVLDRFKYDSVAGDYDLKKLIRPNSKHILPRAFESGDRWHSNSGWFWEHPSMHKVLNHMNINSSAVSINYRAPEIYVTIDHMQVLRRDDDAKALLPAHLDADNFTAIVKEFYEPLHLQNKYVVSDLLTPEMCRSLNLSFGEGK